MNGLKLAACYSYPPSSLKLCGVKIKETPLLLHDFLAGKKISIAKIRHALKHFEATYPYYRLIARRNRIPDPFDHEVVEAYWIGNSLLDNVTLTDLQTLIINDFTGPGLLLPEKAKQKARAIPKEALPHHSFHVLILGSVTGRVKFYGPLYDLCCINHGEVIKIDHAKVTICYRPLQVKSNQFFYGNKTEKEVEWDSEFMPDLKIGDLVTVHWNRICQVIEDKQRKKLQKYTQMNINAVNILNQL